LVYVHRKKVKLKFVRTPGKLATVPNKPGTQHRSVRVSDEDWADLEAAAAVLGADRASVIRQFIHWYLRRPGAKLPERPTAGFWAAQKAVREQP
jgi:hypothetical protein